MIGKFPEFIPPEHIDGIRYVGRELVHEDDISDINFVSNQDGQPRIGEKAGARASAFFTSFNQGIDFNQPLPNLEKRKDGKYDRFNGFGRDSGLRRLKGYEGWYVYDVFECDHDLARLELRYWLNRTLPQQPNHERDIVKGYVNAIEKKSIRKDEDIIRASLKRGEPHLAKSEITRLVNVIMAHVGGRKEKIQKITSFTHETVYSRWVKHHWADLPDYGFIDSSSTRKPNLVGGVWQTTLTSSTRGNNSYKVKLYDAIRRFKVEGFGTQILLVIENASNLEELNKRRKWMIENILDFKRITNTDDSIWESAVNLVGFVPQHEDELPKYVIDWELFR